MNKKIVLILFVLLIFSSCTQKYRQREFMNKCEEFSNDVRSCRPRYDTLIYYGFHYAIDQEIKLYDIMSEEE